MNFDDLKRFLFAVSHDFTIKLGGDLVIRPSRKASGSGLDVDVYVKGTSLADPLIFVGTMDFETLVKSFNQRENTFAEFFR